MQSFATCGQRFSGIEPHFKDYKSAAFDVLRSGLWEPEALTCLFMLLDCAGLIALILGMMLILWGQRSRIDWHGHHSPPPAFASLRKQEA
ncbi:MAG: hypothetical protein AAGM45_23160 [Cyanobacteria bacterium J06588_5]